MKNGPELSLLAKSLINTLAFIATALVFLIALGLSPVIVFFYIIYNIFYNLKNNGDAAANKWAANGKVSLPHAKLF